MPLYYFFLLRKTWWDWLITERLWLASTWLLINARSICPHEPDPRPSIHQKKVEPRPGRLPDIDGKTQPQSDLWSDVHGGNIHVRVQTDPLKDRSVRRWQTHQNNWNRIDVCTPKRNKSSQNNRRSYSSLLLLHTKKTGKTRKQEPWSDRFLKLHSKRNICKKEQFISTVVGRVTPHFCRLSPHPLSS